jgi:hypothetical protein
MPIDIRRSNDVWLTLELTIVVSCRCVKELMTGNYFSALGGEKVNVERNQYTK